jgi:hypothetical protein
LKENKSFEDLAKPTFYYSISVTRISEKDISITTEENSRRSQKFVSTIIKNLTSGYANFACYQTTTDKPQIPSFRWEAKKFLFRQLFVMSAKFLAVLKLHSPGILGRILYACHISVTGISALKRHFQLLLNKIIFWR